MKNLLSEHRCEAVVVHCIDFRFHDVILSFLQDDLGLESYDIIAIAGAGRHLTSIGSAERRAGLVEDIAISVRLHDPKQIVIINHADCGAYGGRKSFPSDDAEKKAHRDALEEAAKTLRDAFPDREVKTLFAGIENGNIWLD